MESSSLVLPPSCLTRPDDCHAMANFVEKKPALRPLERAFSRRRFAFQRTCHSSPPLLLDWANKNGKKSDRLSLCVQLLKLPDLHICQSKRRIHVRICLPSCITHVFMRINLGGVSCSLERPTTSEKSVCRRRASCPFIILRLATCEADVEF